MHGMGVTIARAVVAGAAVVLLSGCTAGSASPEASCRPVLTQGGRTYAPVDPQPTDLATAAAVAGAEYGGCRDAGQATSGAGAVDAWRAAGRGDAYLLTLTACADAEGTGRTTDCRPDAPRYVVWQAEPTSS